MSKAKRIIALLAEGKTVAETAEIVGCLNAYVRVVRQREMRGGSSVGDRNYVAKNRQTINRRNADRSTKYYHVVPVAHRMDVFREAYEDAKARGYPSRRACSLAGAVVVKLGRQLHREQSQ